MKTSVFDLNDLQSAAPVFKGCIGSFIGNRVIKLLSIDKVNGLHERNCHLTGYEFTNAILNEIEVSYKLHGEENLDNLPEGAFITVSNHPFGSIDGIMLIDILARRRPDFAVMVNGILTNIEAMKDNFIDRYKNDLNELGDAYRKENQEYKIEKSEDDLFSRTKG